MTYSSQVTLLILLQVLQSSPITYYDKKKTAVFILSISNKIICILHIEDRELVDTQKIKVIE